MDAQWLLDSGPWARAAAVALILLPATFIAGSRRARWWSKVLWIVASQLPWLFAALYAWLSQQRYGGATPGWLVAGAVGWWTYAFPWAVYLLFRGTRRWFPGEARR